MDRNELPTLLVLAASPPGPMTVERHLPLLLCPLPMSSSLELLSRARTNTTGRPNC